MRHTLLVFSVATTLLLTGCAADNEAEEAGATGNDADTTDSDDSEGTAAGTEAWEPSQNVTMTVAGPAGGGTDRMARAIADGLQEVRSGLTIVVENRPGASNVTGYNHVAQMDADPHQLLAVEPNVMNVPILQDAPFYWADDFTPIGQVSEYFAAAISQPGRFDSLQDLIDTAATEPLTVGLGGLSGPLAIATVLMEQDTGVEFERVVFDGGNEITAAVLAGDVDLGMPAPGNIVDFLKAGDLDALALFAEKGFDEGPLSAVPTAVEAGVNVTASGFRGLFATTGISDAERQYWIDAFEDWTETDAYAEYNEENYSIPSPRLGDEFTEHLHRLEEQVRPAIEAIADARE